MQKALYPDFVLYMELKLASDYKNSDQKFGLFLV